MSAVQAPPRGPGRPRKPQAPRSDAQARLALDVESAEKAREEAAAAYAGETNVAAELALLTSELSVTTAWGAYLRSQGNHAQALKYGDIGAKYAARITALRELLAVDQLEAIKAIKDQEVAAGRMVAG